MRYLALFLWILALIPFVFGIDIYLDRNLRALVFGSIEMIIGGMLVGFGWWLWTQQW